jgi:hypothetical protein
VKAIVSTAISTILFSSVIGAPQFSHAEDQNVIQVVSALYGKPNAARPVNFTARLQQTCGPSATDCEAFCSNAFVGHTHQGLSLPFSPGSICRVTYRCGAQSTLVTDAERNDLIVLTCRNRF